jgi:ABC-type nitrate/sulfonate/bicarbonate transport system substrate-binding protein
VINVLTVQRAYLEAHPDHGRALLDAWFAGQQEFRRSQASRDWVARRLDLTPEQLERAFADIALFDREGSRQMLSGPAGPLRAVAHRFHGFMRENGRLSKDVPVDEMFRLPAGWSE